MTKEGEEQEKDKLRRGKAQVEERRKLIEVRKSSSDRLFMLERNLSLAGSLTELRTYAQELLSAKVKRQVRSNGNLYLPLKNNCAGFPAHKGAEISTVKITIAPLNVGSTEPPAFIEDTFHIPRRQKRVSGI